MTLEETTQVLRLLGAAYPNTKLSDATIVAYHTGLRDMDAETARSVAVDLIRSSKFFPSVAELRSTAGFTDPARLTDNPLQLAEQRRLARGTLEVFGPERAREILGDERFHALLGDAPEAANALSEAVRAELGAGQ